LLVIATGCKKETTHDTPDQFEELEITNSTQIGRVLFYDKHLSVNNTVSCASCHKQAYAFSDNVAFSKGVFDQSTLRNSPPIQNLNLNEGFNMVALSLFWDGRETDLNKMVLQPIVNHIEMGIKDLDELCRKLEAIPYYEELFEMRYGTKEITPEKLSNELSWFVQGIVGNSEFDKGNLTAEQKIGEELFITKYQCNQCHQVQSPHGYLFTPQGGFSDIGLDPIPTDQGRAEITGEVDDLGKFKIPSLRNVALTAPYMHDGRFKTLDEVIEHYNKNISDSPNLDEALKDPSSGKAKKFNISKVEKEALIAFLHSMNSYEMITNPAYSNPFKTNKD
jgi:cytochrome c peroxidase